MKLSEGTWCSHVTWITAPLAKATAQTDKEKRPQLLPTKNVFTGEPQQALQTPMHSDIRRISTAVLFKWELQRRPESRALLETFQRESHELSVPRAVP
jgi:hypothetical protein